DLLRFDWRPGDTYQVHDKRDGASVTSDFLEWEASVRRPYFAMLNYMEAHAGYAAPLDTLFGTERTRQVEYDGSIRWLDGELRRLFEALAARGTLERTVVILTSDHGEAFGEHDIHGHGKGLYTTLIHVPLMIYAPGRLDGGVRIGRTVSLRDIARTIQEFTGSKQPPFPGQPLTALTKDPNAAASPAIAELSNVEADGHPATWPNMIAALDDTLHVIRDYRGRISAYAYRTDVMETTDLAAADSTRSAVFLHWLEQTQQRAGLDPRRSTKGPSGRASAGAALDSTPTPDRMMRFAGPLP
ncbi:MAG: sulfatase-like hydrolase/transferase, partial [Gemmatimonadota bacterium]